MLNTPKKWTGVHRKHISDIRYDLDRLNEDYDDCKSKAIHLREVVKVTVSAAERWERSRDEAKVEYEKRSAQLRANVAWLKAHGLNE